MKSRLVATACAFSAVTIMLLDASSAVKVSNSSSGSSSSNVKMASQPWTQMVVSNAVNETKEWVKINYSDGDTPIDKEKDMWLSDDGKSLKYMLNGVEMSMTIDSVSFANQVEGFDVVSVSDPNGAVSNKMFYADIGNGKYSCPSNVKIPTLELDCIVTQIVSQVVSSNLTVTTTNFYQNIKVEEYVTVSNQSSIIKWTSEQTSPNMWRIFNIDTDLNLRYFTVYKTKGDALPNSPLE